MMIENLYRKTAGFSLAVFPPMLLAGFLMHPDLLSFKLSDSTEALVANFHHQWLFHVGHLIVFLSIPFILLGISYLMTLPKRKGQGWMVIGGILGIIGGTILAGDKGALCMVLSAFDTLSEADFNGIAPALGAIVGRKGVLPIFYLLPLLPLGAAAQWVGLIKGGRIQTPLGVAAIAGLLLLNNPDIELISSVGAILMCVGYIPLGIRIMNGKID